MANFEAAQEVLDKIEGGYVHDPLDRGGETYNGISRKNFPDWEGWEIIDNIKNQAANLAEIKEKLKGHSGLKQKVNAFYKEHFWDKMKLDEVTSDVVAQNIYLFGVVAGISRSIKTTQQIVGADVDGKLGAKSIELINKMDANEFKVAFDKAEIAHFNTIVQKRPEQERFLKGWVNRANLV